MALHATHDAFHGSAVSFDTWRERLAEVAGLPSLFTMRGHAPTRLPGEGNQEWPEDIHPSLKFMLLLRATDVGESIPVTHLLSLALVLEELALRLPEPESDPDFNDGPNVPGLGVKGGVKLTTEQFAAGCRRAFERDEPIEFY